MHTHTHRVTFFKESRLEMAYQLALAVLAENMRSIPSTQMVAYKLSITLVPGELMPSSGPYKHAHGA